MDCLLAEIDRRLQALFRRLADGDDAPPSMLLRLEGLLEAGHLLGAASEEQLQQRIDEAHRDAVGETLESALGYAWRERFPFPQIPAYMHRAPVTPSTAD